MNPEQNMKVHTLLIGLLEYCEPFVPPSYFKGQDETIAAGETYLVFEFIMSWVDDFEIPLGDDQKRDFVTLNNYFSLSFPEWFEKHLQS